MGNMLESDSSNNSDDGGNNDESAITKGAASAAGTGTHRRERTAGDGMESHLIKHNTSVDSSGSGRSKQSSQNEMPKVPYSPEDVVDNLELLKLSEQGIKIVEEKCLLNVDVDNVNSHQSSSPREMPSRDLLIPIKPQKLQVNAAKGHTSTATGSTSYDKFTAVGLGKTKTPKFIPYEPYSCAVRPMSSNKKHSRKGSDSSSIVSQSSILSNSVFDGPTTNTDIQTEGAIIKPVMSHDRQQSQSTPTNIPLVQNQSFSHQTTNNQNSNALMKERLKIAEKEVVELQSENQRLKKLLVNAISGSGNDDTTAKGNVVTQSMMNNNTPRGHHNESFDNLSDELEVWRSKFLSSCVLVEQLNKENHRLVETVGGAAELIKELKNTASSLTQLQYENINEWFRKANILPTPYASSQQNKNYKNFVQDS